jgi:Na+-transporting NADH:ubiquinone oxidoreductase subunit A
MPSSSPGRVHRVRRGLDLRLAGAPAAAIEDAARVGRIALLGGDTVGLKPSFHVQPGVHVRRGQLLYEDKGNPGVRWTSPSAGSVAALHRGERRAFTSLVIDVAHDDADDNDDAQVGFVSLSAARDGADMRALLLESGLWTALRTRPYGQVPAPDSEPRAIFVSAIDTQPHAPDVQLALAGREADFADGMAAIERLSSARVLLCRAAGSTVAPGANSRAEVHEFSGPHPAGAVGLHIHRLHPVDASSRVWHIGGQDVAAIGHLLRTGRLDVHRIISLAGPAVRQPRLLRTRLGASITELTRGELLPGTLRVLSGSVLSGRQAADEAVAYLGRYHLQVSALHEFDAAQRRWLGGLRARQGVGLSASTHGPVRPMLPVGAHEAVWPFDIEPVLLLRALLAQDTEQVERLGGVELDEEDLALSSFICPSKQDYGAELRRALELIRQSAA